MGVFGYVYDGWNRLRQVQRYDAGDPNDATTIADYEYDGQNRRTQKVVTKSPASRPIPTTAATRPCITTTTAAGASSKSATAPTRSSARMSWGRGIPTNSSASTSTAIRPPATTAIPTSPIRTTPERDARYFVHQDRNWNVVALTAYSPDPNDPNWPVNGAVVERYSQTPYGSFTVFEGATDSAGREGDARLTSLVGNAFVHQGLPFDAEKGSYQNRWREYARALQIFVQRDPLRLDLSTTIADQTRDGLNAVSYQRRNPTRYVDTRGRACADPGDLGATHPLGWGAILEGLVEGVGESLGDGEFSIGQSAPMQGCSQIKKEKKGICLCTERCLWQCNDSALLVSWTPDDGSERTSCTVFMGPGTLCTQDTVLCFIGDVSSFSFSCHPSPDSCSNVRTDCSGPGADAFEQIINGVTSLLCESGGSGGIGIGFSYWIAMHSTG